MGESDIKLDQVLALVDSVPSEVHDFSYLHGHGPLLAQVIHRSIGIVNGYYGPDELSPAYRIDETQLKRDMARDLVSKMLGGTLLQTSRDPLESLRHTISAAHHFASLAFLVEPEMGNYPIGNPRKMRDLSSHNNRDVDLERVFESLILDKREGLKIIFACDEPNKFNVGESMGIQDMVTRFVNWHRNKDKSDMEFLKAARLAKAIGIRDQLYFQAWIETLLLDEKFLKQICDKYGEKMAYFTDFYLPVVLMSDFVDENPVIRDIFCVLADITKIDDKFCQMLWDCVPPDKKISIFEKAGFSKNRAATKDYKTLTPEEKALVMESLGYALTQIAASCVATEKFGHFEGEARFDAHVDYVMTHHLSLLKPYLPNRRFNPHYLDKDPSGFTKAPVPYAAYDHGKPAKRDRISLSQPNDGKDLFGVIAQRLDRFFRVYLNFFRIIDYCDYLSDFDRERLLEAEILKALREIFFTLKHAPDFAYVMESMGLEAFFDGKKSLAELQAMENLPFKMREAGTAAGMVGMVGRGARREHHKDNLRLFAKKLPKEVDEVAAKRREELKGVFGQEFFGLDGQNLLSFTRQTHDHEAPAAYLIRYMSKVLSGPASQNPKLQSLLNEFFGSLIKIIYPDYVLVSEESWDFQAWRQAI